VSDSVLNASALLALLNQEPGSETVEAVIAQSVMSVVNLAEVISKLADRGLSQETIKTVLSGLGFEIVAYNEQQAWKTGLLRPQTRTLGLSLGDRACLALAIQANLPILTADRAWENLNLGVAIQVIR
jgi:PIN domain nuclease of toxin-antitoxin system